MNRLDRAFAAVLNVKTYIIVGLCAFVIGSGLGGFTGYRLAWNLQDGNIATLKKDQAEAQTKAIAAALQHERAQGGLTKTAGEKAEVHQAAIRVVYRKVYEKVTEYVSPQADARCVLPVGFIRLHDAAATASPPNESLVAPGQPHDAASGVDCSRAIDTIAHNYELYASVAQQLNDILDLAEAQAKLDPPN